MKTRLLWFCILALGTSLVIAQQKKGKKGRKGGKGGASKFVEMERQALAEPFRGVTTDGQVQKDLFDIASTGVSTEPVRQATQAFLAALSDTQRAKSTFPIEDDEWRKWANMHSYPRQGVSFEEMTDAQRQLAFDMIGAGLSAKGLRTTQDIMKLNLTIAEMSDRIGEAGYGQWAYYLTIMGTPSTTEPWGWQFDGHHCVINYFVLGDQVVMTPLFLGSEPVWAEAGKFKGTIVLQEEQNMGLALAQSLSAKQRDTAVITSEKAGTNANTEAFRDNVVIPTAGIPYTALDTSQQQALLDLTSEWIGHLREGHAQVKMAEIRKHLDQTHFAWIGAMEDDSVFYYRIQSPVVLIEFDHQRPIALARDGIPTRQHIHATIRTPNGNDYGKDLLRQHLQRHH